MNINGIPSNLTSSSILKETNMQVKEEPTNVNGKDSFVKSDFTKSNFKTESLFPYFDSPKGKIGTVIGGALGGASAVRFQNRLEKSPQTSSPLSLGDTVLNLAVSIVGGALIGAAVGNMIEKA